MVALPCPLIGTHYLFSLVTFIFLLHVVSQFRKGYFVDRELGNGPELGLEKKNVAGWELSNSPAVAKD